MAIEIQERKKSKKYFSYALIISVLVLIFYFSIINYLSQEQADLEIISAPDITKGLADIEKQQAAVVFDLPVFKTLVKYELITIKDKLGRANPFASINTSTPAMINPSPKVSPR